MSIASNLQIYSQNTNNIKRGVFIMSNNRILTKREIRNELFGILSMCDAFTDEGSMVGGKRKEEMIKYLPKQIAVRIMDLQDLIDECKLQGD